MHWLLFVQRERVSDDTRVNGWMNGSKRKMSVFFLKKREERMNRKSPYLLQCIVRMKTNQQLKSIKHKSRTNSIRCSVSVCSWTKINLSIYWHAYSVHIFVFGDYTTFIRTPHAYKRMSIASLFRFKKIDKVSRS